VPPPVERDRPVFVVGPSRSGTSMLRESLNRGGRIWIARETHWFDDLRTTLPTGRLDGADAARCRDYFLRLAHRAYGAEADPDAATIDPAELAAEAASLGGSGDAWFAAFCRLRARANGRGRWGEKTPRHAFRIDELLAAFPSARVVCLIRDPRAVVASYRDWTTRAASFSRPTRRSAPATGSGSDAPGPAFAARSVSRPIPPRGDLDRSRGELDRPWGRG